MSVSGDFAGAFLGALTGVLVIIGLLLLWDYWERRKERGSEETLKKKVSAEQVLEQQLEEYIVEHFHALFRGWRIFEEEPEKENREEGRSYCSNRPAGVRYRTKAGEIDLLCYDPRGNLVVIELKRDRAPDRVVAQVDRYMAWVKANLAQENQRVWGLIIARRFDERLFHTLQRRRDIKMWTYEWKLHFDKRPTPG